MIIKAAPGRTVRDPVTKRVIPPDGMQIVMPNFYWQRRLRDGDVIEVKQPAPPAPAPEPAHNG